MTLHLYFARKFLAIFAGLFVTFGVLVTLLDMVEQLRRYDEEGIALDEAFELALLAMPESLYAMLPLVVVLATIALFLGLARTSELVVTRAAGRSALRAVIAPALVAVGIGGVGVAVMNPIVAGTIQTYDARAEAYAGEGRQIVSVSPEGLWLRQGGRGGQTVIRADRANPDGTVLHAVTFIAYAPPAAAARGPVRRIEAARAELADGAWALEDAKVWPLDAPNPERAAETHARLAIPSTLTREQIRDSFGAPAAVPIWELPAFIEDLTAAGFSARAHRVWLQSELAQPLFLAAMVLIGAAFTMRPARFGRTGLLVMLALMLGFGMHFVRNFAGILAEDGQIPAALAAWAPPAAGVLLALGLMLSLEDG